MARQNDPVNRLCPCVGAGVRIFSFIAFLSGYHLRIVDSVINKIVTVICSIIRKLEICGHGI